AVDKPTICSIDGCETRARSRGWCDKHYQRWRTYGDANAKVRPRSANVGPCAVEGCDTPSRKRGWCASHYSQWQRAGETRPFYYKWADKKKCAVCGEEDWRQKGRKDSSGRCQQSPARQGGRRTR